MRDAYTRAVYTGGERLHTSSTRHTRIRQYAGQWRAAASTPIHTRTVIYRSYTYDRMRSFIRDASGVHTDSMLHTHIRQYAGTPIHTHTLIVVCQEYSTVQRPTHYMCIGGNRSREGHTFPGCRTPLSQRIFLSISLSQ